ncbi:RNA methyltransferase [Candidatus Dependentiae bacterium]|nr:RNA methyltransferase [Candidatus Dependentiae bacterium]
MSVAFKQKLFDEFAQYITDKRRNIFDKNAAERTRYVTVVLEDIYQPPNISAVLRTCDCFGIQDVHIIEDKHRYRPNEAVAKGSAQWLSLTRYNKSQQATADCFTELRSKGYRIVGATPHEQDTLIDALPLDTKTAVVFGSERWGLSSYGLDNVDAFVKVPMYGFTESFNISVSAAIALYELTKRLRQSSLAWRLSPDELIDLKLEWLGAVTNRTHQIAERLLEGSGGDLS